MNIYEQRCKELREEIGEKEEQILFLTRQLHEADSYFRLIRNAAEDGLDEIHCD